MRPEILQAAYIICFSPDAGEDLEEQAQYLDAMLDSAGTLPGWMGLCWWKWDAGSDFSIVGKKAENVFRRWVENAKKVRSL